MSKQTPPPDVLEALQQGDKIEAIKRLRAATGLGLKDAKDWIDAYERGGVAPPRKFERPEGANPNAAFKLSPEALEALKKGNMIEAIKQIRSATGMGLAEVKSIVEAVQKEMRAASADSADAPAAMNPRTGQRLAPGEVASAGSAAKWMVLAAVAAVVVMGVIYA